MNTAHQRPSEECTRRGLLFRFSSGHNRQCEEDTAQAQTWDAGARGDLSILLKGMTVGSNMLNKPNPNFNGSEQAEHHLFETFGVENKQKSVIDELHK